MTFLSANYQVKFVPPRLLFLYQNKAFYYHFQINSLPFYNEIIENSKIDKLRIDIASFIEIIKNNSDTIDKKSKDSTSNQYSKATEISF